MASQATHSDLVSLAVGTTISFVTVGTITVAAGGPWKLHNIFGTVVRATATAAEQVGGFMKLVAPSGDVTPDPSPSIWPIGGVGSLLGTTAPAATAQMYDYPVDLTVAGKGSIQMQYSNGSAITVSPFATLGIMYGPSIPAVKRFTFCQESRGAVTTVAETTLPTITLSEKASRIVGISAFIQQDNVIVTAEELIASVRLSSDDTDLAPSIWPFNVGFHAGIGTTINGGEQHQIKVMPVDIPVEAGSRIVPNVALGVAVTNQAFVGINIYYE